MNLKYALPVVAAAALALSCAKKDNDELAHHHHNHENHHHEHSEGHEAHHHHGHEGENEVEEDDDVIKLSPEAAALFDLKTAEARAHEFNAVVKVGGTVEASNESSAVVTAPTAGIVTLAKGVQAGSDVAKGATVATVRADGMSGGDGNLILKVELDAAEDEFARVESLYADRLVTLSEYNAARTAYEKAKAAYSAPAASGRAVAPISGVISSLDAVTGQYVEAGAPIASVMASKNLIIRGDVPIKSYRSVAQAEDARMVAGNRSVLISELAGRRIGRNTVAGSSGGYVPMAFSVENDGTLIPGQTVDLYILGPAERRVLAVPSSAITEQQGTYFVYRQLDEDCYRRLPVVTGVSDGEYTEILSGLSGGENIVVQGVAAVRLAQTSGAVPEGHSHSH